MLQSKLGSPFLVTSTAFPSGLREGQGASGDLHCSQYVCSPPFNPYSGKAEESPEHGLLCFFFFFKAVFTAREIFEVFHSLEA